MGRKLKNAKSADSEVKNKKPSKRLNQQSLDEFVATLSDDDDYIKDNFESDEGESEEKGPKNKKKEKSSSDEKKYLTQLQQKDPEFYKFLKENDEDMLHFDADNDDEADDSDSNEELDDDYSSSEIAEEEEEDTSEESDDEPEDDESNEKEDKVPNGVKEGGLPHSSLAKQWQVSLEAGKVNASLLSNIAVAFEDAVAHCFNEGKKPKSFNDSKSVIDLCLTHMPKAFRIVLGVKDKTISADVAFTAKTMQKSKNWEQLKPTLSTYANAVAKVLGSVKDSTELRVWLQHVQAMLPCFVAGGSSVLLEELVSSWSNTDDAAVSSLAFQSVLSLTRRNLATNFKPVFERMHTEYVAAAERNGAASKRESLSQITALDAKAACKLSLEAVRGLEADLKTEKEGVICDWKFVRSLQRWSNVLCDLKEENLRQQVMLPLVQVLVGVLKLFSTSQYYPLRFRICDMLTEISSRTGKFVPVLPHYLDVLRNYDFSKKTVTATKLQPDLLKVPKSLVSDNSLNDLVADGVYKGMLKYLGLHSHLIAFPELVVPALAELKAWAAKGNVAGYNKRINQLAEKIEENSRHISMQRRNAAFGVKSSENIVRWEEAVRGKGTPLARLYTTCTSTTENGINSNKKKSKNKAKKRKLKKDHPKEINEVIPVKKIKKANNMKAAKANGTS